MTWFPAILMIFVFLCTAFALATSQGFTTPTPPAQYLPIHPKRH